MGWTYGVDSDAPTNAGGIVGVGVFFTLVSLVVVVLRVYVRARVVRNLIIDDWIIVGTWFTSLIFLSITIAQTRWGLGLQNTTDIPPQNVIESAHLQYAGAPFYILSIFGFKLSILFSFLRQAVDITYRKAITGIIISLGTFHFLYFFIQLGLCNPVSKQWNPSIEGTCIPAIPFHTATSALTLLFDLLTLITPIPLLIFALPTLSPLKRLLIALLSTLALFTSLIQILRLVAIHDSNTSSLLTWSIIETNLGIVCCSLLSLSPLFASLGNRNQNTSRPVSSIRTSTSSSKTKSISFSLTRTRARLARVREDSEVWRRVERFLGYGELPHSNLTLPRHTLSPSESRPGTSLSRSLSSRMGSRIEMIGNRFGMGMGSRLGSRRASLESRNGPHIQLDWSSDFGGIVKTTEVIVSREISIEVGGVGGEGRSSRSASLSGGKGSPLKPQSGEGSPLKVVEGSV